MEIVRAVTEIWCTRTDGPTTTPGLPSTDVENCNVRANWTHQRFRDFHLLKLFDFLSHLDFSTDQNRRNGQKSKF